MTGSLRVFAAEADDVPIISALCQDALTMRLAMNWSSPARRLVLLLERLARERDGTVMRVEAALTVRAVQAVQARRLDGLDPSVALVLLAMTFTPDEPPGGILTIAFAGYGAPSLRLTVEAVDLTLEDLTHERVASALPDHG